MQAFFFKYAQETKTASYLGKMKTGENKVGNPPLSTIGKTFE
jgi:hypothetical protein